MQYRPKRVLLGTILLVGLLSLTAAVWAQTSARFDMRWHAITSAGATSHSASYVVHSSVGQPWAGSAHSASYTVHSGYAAGMVSMATPTPEVQKLYLPNVGR